IHTVVLGRGVRVFPENPLSTAIEPRSFHSPHEIRRTYAESIAEAHDHPESRTLNAAFDGTKIRAINLNLDVNAHLRQSSRLPNFPQHNPKGLFRTESRLNLPALRHEGFSVMGMMVINQRVITIILKRP